MCAGLLDRAERLKRAYEDELARRGSILQRARAGPLDLAADCLHNVGRQESLGVELVPCR